MIKCPVALQNKACWEASSFKTFKNVLQTAVNKEQAFDVPVHFFFFLSKDSNLKKGTTVGDEFTPSILNGGGPVNTRQPTFSVNALYAVAL